MYRPRVFHVDKKGNLLQLNCSNEDLIFATCTLFSHFDSPSRRRAGALLFLVVLPAIAFTYCKTPKDEIFNSNFGIMGDRLHLSSLRIVRRHSFKMCLFFIFAKHFE